MGEVHRACLVRYGELVGRTAESLQQDSRVFDPAHAAYSPLGIVYGFCADLFSNMVLNTLSSASSTELSLEDLFESPERLEEKRRRRTNGSACRNGRANVLRSNTQPNGRHRCMPG